MFQAAATAIDWLGVIAFAVTGAVVASRKGMDVMRFVVLGTVTGIGGGTLRDVLLSLPIFGFANRFTCLAARWCLF